MKRVVYFYFAIAFAVVSTITSANIGQACPMDNADSCMVASNEPHTLLSSQDAENCHHEDVHSAPVSTTECPMSDSMCTHGCGSDCCAGNFFHYSMSTPSHSDATSLLDPATGERIQPVSSTLLLSFHPEAPYRPPVA